MSEQQLIWHYTTGDVFKRILKQGAILPDKSEPDNPKERPTVTFSTNQDWERTRYRVGRLPDGQLVMMGKKLLNQFCGGLIRIGVHPNLAPMDWHEMKDRVGLSRNALKGIYEFALNVGARTSQWFSTFLPIPEDQWLSVQKYTTEGTWIDLPEDEIPDVTDVEEVPLVKDIQAEPSELNFV
jgi:hypothetical protein